MPTNMKKILIISALFFFLAPQAEAAIIFNGYTCADHFSGAALSGGATCSGTTLTFSSSATQSAANNGSGNTLINIYVGAGVKPFVSVTTANQTGSLQMRCFGDTANCDNVNLTAGVNTEVALTSPTQLVFEYIVFGNNGNTATGDIDLSTLCIDDDGTSCTPVAAAPIFRSLFSPLWLL